MKPLLVIVLLAVLGGTTVGDLAARAPSASRLKTLSTKDLIGRFQQESEQTVAADAAVTMEGFVGVDASLKFGGGLLGVPPPKISPEMRELVRRGLAAMPALLNHLTDARATKLLITSNRNIGSMQFFNEEYDPKNFAAKELPAGVHRPSGASDRDELFMEYRIRVGDLCYATLGQIVGRRLNAARYQPNGLFYMNSPVRTPALAAAARADWAGMTPEEFAAYLVRDLERNEDNWSNMSVLQRLMFYDPSVGTAQAVKLLHRGVYDDKPVSEFLAKLWKVSEAEEMGRLVDEFRSKHDDSAYQAVRQSIILSSVPLTAEEAEIFPEGVSMQKHVAELKSRRFAEADEETPFTRLWLRCGDQCELVETLASCRSAAIDDGVRDLFDRAVQLRAEDPEDKFAQCLLAAECVKRFASPRHQKEIARVCDQLDRKAPRAMDAFLHKLASDPALRLPATVR